MTDHAGETVHCSGGITDPIYHGLATGLCPSCGEFVALINTGQTVRHWLPAVAQFGSKAGPMSEPRGESKPVLSKRERRLLCPCIAHDTQGGVHDHLGPCQCKAADFGSSTHPSTG